jgi:hypothetical protein
MKPIIVSATLLIAVATQAQISKIPVGKKVQLESSSKLSTKISVMGQEMEIPATTTLMVDLVPKSIDANTLNTGVTLRKVFGSSSMMGQEMTFSSDDKSVASMPQAAELMKNLNKEEDVALEDGKIKGKANVGMSGLPTNAELAKMVFLTLGAANIKEGYKWTEEISNDGSKTNTIYTVTKVTATEIEVAATTNMKLEGTVQQMGMDVKQNLTGTTTSVRVYDAATAILKADATKTEMSGTVLAMGNEAPVSISTITTTTVK